MPGEEKPLLDLRFFKLKTYRVGVGGGLIYRMGFGAIPLLLPLMLQLGFGLTPFRSGMLTCAAASGVAIHKDDHQDPSPAYGFVDCLFIRLLDVGHIAALGLFTAHTPHAVIFIVLLVGGGFRVMQFTALNTICYAEVPEKDISQATSLFSTMQQLALGLGVTLGALFLQASNYLQHHPRIVTADFWPAFLAVGLFSAASAYSAFSLSHDDGAEMAGRATASAAASG